MLSKYFIHGEFGDATFDTYRILFILILNSERFKLIIIFIHKSCFKEISYKLCRVHGLHLYKIYKSISFLGNVEKSFEFFSGQDLMFIVDLP